MNVLRDIITCAITKRDIYGRLKYSYFSPFHAQILMVLYDRLIGGKEGGGGGRRERTMLGGMKTSGIHWGGGWADAPPPTFELC